MAPLRILGFASSLRSGSTSTGKLSKSPNCSINYFTANRLFNIGLLRAAKARLPVNTQLDIYVPKGLPFFNEDTEKQVSIDNQAVIELRQKVKDADAILFSVCEYNHSISAPLKNALDWASRGPHGNCFNQKPGAMMGVGGEGGIRAQRHLRDIAGNLNLYLINHPHCFVRIYDPKSTMDFQTGDIKDETVYAKVDAVIKSLVDWTLKLNK